jgi:hypothetical protein
MAPLGEETAVVDLDLSLAERTFICRACAWLRLDHEPGDWFQPFLILRLQSSWPALADRIAHFDKAELQKLVRFIQIYQWSTKER